ncbi:MAG: tryptophan-rich sensory protein [Candidatus Pacebacteria bacterium]|nr:tryptophan-rich sensory protein [Candidatus Paceibacterota bacterium]
MNQTYSWYSNLIKPPFAPPSWIFGPVWSVLYIIIAITFTRVFYLAIKGAIPWIIVVPFILNIIFNLSFTPLQFGLKNNYLAAIDIILVLGTLIWAICAIWPHSRIIAYAQVPYLLWVIFATVLQLSVTWLNR